MTHTGVIVTCGKWEDSTAIPVSTSSLVSFVVGLHLSLGYLAMVFLISLTCFPVVGLHPFAGSS